MSTHDIRVNDLGGLGIFNLLAEGLSFRTRQPDHFERPDSIKAGIKAQAPRRTWLDRIDDWFWRRHQRSVEMRLAQAEDIFELERLIRGLERGDVRLHD